MNYGGFDKTMWQKRTHTQHKQAVDRIKMCKSMTQAKKLESELGFRYTEFLNLPYYHSTRFCIIDPMHNLFLGTAKFMWSLWLELDLINKNDICEIERRIKSVNAPSDCGWIPSGMSSNWGSFNAHEWKSWTTVYSMFALNGLLPNDHLKCWQTFVLACNKISKMCVSTVDTAVADMLFVKFGKQFELLYGNSRVTPNMHLHCHLFECMQDYGSVYGFWLFLFERYNGILGSIPTNHKDIEVQLMNKFLETDRLHSLEHEMPKEFSKIFRPLCNEQKNTHMKHFSDFHEIAFAPETTIANCSNVWEKLSCITLPNVFKVGSFDVDEHILLKCTYQQMYPDLNITLQSIPNLFHKYSFIYICNEHFGSKLYSRSKRLSYVLASWCNTDGGISDGPLRPGKVKFYAKHCLIVNDVFIPHVFAIVEWHKPFETSVYLEPISQWSKSTENPGRATFVPVQRIHSKCATIDLNDSIVVSSLKRQIHL